MNPLKNNMSSLPSSRFIVSVRTAGFEPARNVFPGQKLSTGNPRTHCLLLHARLRRTPEPFTSDWTVPGYEAGTAASSPCVGAEGLEPPTCRFVIYRSIRLSYAPV